MSFIHYEVLYRECTVGTAQQLQAVALRRGNELLRVPAHHVVFFRRNKVNLEIALIGVGLKLIDVVGNRAARIKGRGNNSAGRGIEPPDGNLVVGKRCTSCRSCAGCRIIKLMRRVVTDTSGESLRAKRRKIAHALLVGNQVQLGDGRRLRKE